MVGQSGKEREADIIKAPHSPRGVGLCSLDGMALPGFLNQDKGDRPLCPLFNSQWIWAVPGGGMTLGLDFLGGGLQTDNNLHPEQLRENTPAWKGASGWHRTAPAASTY